MDLGVVMELGEPLAPPDTAGLDALSVRGCLLLVQAPPSEPSRGFLGREGTLAHGLTSRPRSPAPLRLVG
jgi:hypothetical protein